MRRITVSAINRLSVGCLLLVLCPPVTGAQDEERPLPGAVHIDALEMGVGQISIPEAVGLVERAGLGVAIITPHDQSVVEYGLPPLRNILKAQVARESIQTHGAAHYLDNVRTTDENIPAVITIDGAEAIPAYYWEQGPLSGMPTVRNLHKHLLIIGLPSAESYAGIPSIANGFPHAFDLYCGLSLWPAPVVLIGLFMVVQARRRDAADDPHSMKPGLITALIGGLFLVNSFPLCSPYDAYQGDQGEAPYQAAIDYADAQGALTFWAHPEVSMRISQPVPFPASILADSVLFVTTPYTRTLLDTDGYTGFAVFEEGMYVVGKPGGVWDQILLEHCAGLREKPVWAIAELDFESSHADHGVTTSQTVFLVKEKSREDVLDAMRRGAMYARRAPGEQLQVETFSVAGVSGGAGAGMGGHVQLAESPRISFALDIPEGQSARYTILIIRGGDVIKTVSAVGDTNLVLDDPVRGGSGKTYYRCIVMRNDWPVLATNPIFVTIDIPGEQQSAVKAQGASS